MHWACILLPQLALDDVLRRQPDRARPLALIEGPSQRQRVRAVNAAAAREGVQAGHSLSAAQARLPTLAAVAFDPAALQRCRHLLAAWAYRYSDRVSTALDDAVVLEIAGSLGLFGPWPVFAARLRAELDALGFAHRIAVAPNPHAAWVLAGAHDGLAVADADHLQRALDALPLAQARLPADRAAALEHLGLDTLGRLFALPRAALARRYGPDLLDHLDRLCGRLAEPLPAYRPPDAFEQRIEFDHELETVPPLLFPLRRLCADLAAFLAGRDGGVQRFTVRLAHDGRPASALVVGLLAPERDPTRLFELARARLERARVPAPVRALALLADELPAFVPAAHGLFDSRPQQVLDWTQLCERLRARLGDEAVHGLATVEDHRPERAWRAAHPDSDTTTPGPPRPGWLLPRPIPLRERDLQILAGPERIESGWWDGADTRRDYYLVRTASGQHAWVFCAAGERGPFMLHGFFA